MLSDSKTKVEIVVLSPTELEEELAQVIQSVEVLRAKVWSVRTARSVQLNRMPLEFEASDGVDWKKVSSEYGEILPWTDTLDLVSRHLKYLQTRVSKG